MSRKIIEKKIIIWELKLITKLMRRKLRINKNDLRFLNQEYYSIIKNKKKTE